MAISCLLLLFVTKTGAAQFTEDFSSLSRRDSGTAIWNQYVGKIHPSLQVMNYKAGFTPKAVDVGDGRHGVFDTTTYAKFSIGGDLSGNVIRFDTSVYPILKVTNFILEAGWTLLPQGSNPLQIQSLGSVIIRGEIWCQGVNGGDAAGATAGVSGSGRCGGSSGGTGGAFGASGGNGGDIAAAVTGGQGGNFTGTGVIVGGGGGGSWNTTAQPGSDPSASGLGGTGGTSTSDPEFTVINGGAGGGGGAGVAAGAGGGGGGGGGAVIIHAVGNFDLGTSPTSVSGFILASGGIGGNPSGGAGSGGGGGGGSIQVFVGGTINIYNTDAGGASRAEQGTGGGVGGPGRSWFSSVVYNGIGFYTPSEDPSINPGNVEFSASAQEIVTRSQDIGGTLTSFDTLTASPVSADFQILINGSSDNFSGDSTGWTTNLALLKNKRFYKLKAIITTSDVNTPTMLDAITLTYTPGTRTDFQFQAAGCGSINFPDSKTAPLRIYLFLLFAPLLLGLWLRFKAPFF